MKSVARTKHLVWVVDDDRDVREALKDYLQVEGFEVKTFDDGAAAWSAIESGDRRPSAIVLDHHMPRMDGREFRRRQVERVDVAAIPVLVFTASGPLVVPGALVVSKTTPLDALVVTLRAATNDATQATPVRKAAAKVRRRRRTNA